MKNYNLTHLDQLEAEAIFVLRETAAQFEHPGLLFSGGKDSIVMAHLAYKAFYPSKSPFPLVHVDTGHNFPETIEYRDRFVEKLGAKLIVGLVQDSIDRGTAVEETGPNASRNALQSVTLLETIEKESLDAALGGGRRDEEKARAKERFFSHRDAFGQWDPKNQRPELWNLFNGRKTTESTSGCSLLATGLRWMSGSTSKKKRLNYHLCTFLIHAKSLREMDRSLQLVILYLPPKKKLLGQKPFVFERSGMLPAQVLFFLPLPTLMK